MPNGETRRCGGPRAVSMSVRPPSPQALKLGRRDREVCPALKRRYGPARMLHFSKLALVRCPGHYAGYAAMTRAGQPRRITPGLQFLPRAFREGPIDGSATLSSTPRLVGAHQQGTWSSGQAYPECEPVPPQPATGPVVLPSPAVPSACPNQRIRAVSSGQPRLVRIDPDLAVRRRSRTSPPPRQSLPSS